MKKLVIAVLASLALMFGPSLQVKAQSGTSYRLPQPPQPTNNCSVVVAPTYDNLDCGDIPVVINGVTYYLNVGANVQNGTIQSGAVTFWSYLNNQIQEIPFPMTGTFTTSPSPYYLANSGTLTATFPGGSISSATFTSGAITLNFTARVGYHGMKIWSVSGTLTLN